MPDPFKISLRNTIKQLRTQTSISYRTKTSQQICNRLIALEPYRRAKHIALYYAANGEVDLDRIWRSAPLQGKFCYFPVLNEDKTLSFLPATPKTAFKRNQYDIQEPDVSMDLAIPVEQLDLIIMPLVAFDAKCTRLGMGAGYYDRTLEHKKTGHLFGVAYPFQQVDFIAQEPWDVPLDAVVTPKVIYWK